MILVSTVNAGFLDWIKSLDWITGSATTTQATTANVTVGNNEPVVENITITGSTTPSISEGLTSNVEFSFLVMDWDGTDNLDNDTVYMNISLAGAETRENSSLCTGEPVIETGVTLNTTAQWYNCTITMEHWDKGGQWTCTAHVKDSSTFSQYKAVDNCFSLQDTIAINMTEQNITWVNLAVGSVNQLMTDEAQSPVELNITNIGNDNITNITLRAMDLIGEGTTPTDIIGAENFTATWGERLCDYGQYLTNATHLQILANGTDTTSDNQLNFGPGNLETTNNATHICLESFSDIIAQQAYSTIGNTLDADKYWTITAADGVVL